MTQTVRVKRERKETADNKAESPPALDHFRTPNSAPNPIVWLQTMLVFLSGAYAFLEHACTGLGALIALLRAESEKLEANGYKLIKCWFAIILLIRFNSSYVKSASLGDDDPMDEDDNEAETASDAAVYSKTVHKRKSRSPPSPTPYKRKTKSSPSPSPSRSSLAGAPSPSPSPSPSRRRSRSRSRTLYEDPVVAYSEPYGYRMRIRRGQPVPSMPVDPPTAPDGHNGVWYVVTIGRQVGIWPQWYVEHYTCPLMSLSDIHQGYGSEICGQTEWQLPPKLSNLG